MSLSPLIPAVTLRRATTDDVALLEHWDRQAHVIACTTDKPGAERAFDHCDWRQEILDARPDSYHLIAEVSDDSGVRPIGAMQVIDPHTEPTHYWGEIEPNLRALDIWIGEVDALNRGHGSEMMRQALDACFAAPEVTAVVIDPLASNTDAHRFYQRLGFRPVERRLFNDEDDCLVMRLERADWEARS